MGIWITEMRLEDYPAVAAIHQQGIDTRNATFQTEALSWGDFDAKYLQECRLVARLDGGKALGWAALLPVSAMPSYRGVAELSLYVAEEARGQGLGRKLMETMVEASEQAGIWTLQSLVFPENKGSLALHHEFGFKTLCVHEKLGKMDGVFRDVERLERRSSKY
ncbi:GNAT family acetyltransferase [Listeria floridensis FSL S10-1187]|uniref:GNAT family acetyltransferase n=1 Tax=Listeria floridensis FSL S10-1187 TaxID=1265817 RepID=A0ABN0RH30_9LIST|nr:GNAT family N-acetyltransferase [Listeria floridensis]EUJ33232.1 GNAT family acetyltransferase [Listeria floridensis FSL S10-1187]